MKPRIKIGLIAGIIGLVLNACVATLVGLCGPAVALLAGAVAGFLTAQQEKPSSKTEGARAGAVAGAITGGLVIVGQIIGGIGALALIQFSGIRIRFGSVPTPADGVSSQVIYYLSGMATAFCFGIVGALLAAGAGAGTGYLTTPEQPVPPVDPAQG
jgi:hypothetical protein